MPEGHRREIGEFFQKNEPELAKFKGVETVPENYLNGYQRPALGCRKLVQRSHQFVNPVLTKLGNWKEDVRLLALKLLREILK